METRNQFKQLLCRLFRPSILLRTSCNNSTTSSSIFSSSATNTSSLRSLSTNTTSETLTSHDPSSFSSRMLPLHCNNCKPTKNSEIDVVSVVENVNLMNKKKKKKVGTMCPPASPLPPSKKDTCVNYYGFNAMDMGKAEKVKTGTMNTEKKKKKKKMKKKKVFLTNSYGFSSSSEFFTSDEEGGENDEETAMFFSSRTFSSDSSEFYQKPSSRKNNKKKNKRIKSSTRRAPRKGLRAANQEGFRPVVSVEDEKDVDISGIPVMKKSSDPYADIRKSMIEMIIERQIFGGKDLERLLHSYLLLNSHQHHSFILRAFADISEVLFGY